MFRKLFYRKKEPITLDVMNGYAYWSKSYPAVAHNPLMEIEQQAMLSLLPVDLDGQVCLDLACGSGRYMHLLQKRRALQVIGLDYSPHMLARVNDPKSPSVQAADVTDIGPPKLVQAPFLALPFANEMFDVISCGLAVGHEKDLHQFLAGAARVLRPGGILLYSDLHPLGTLLGWQRTFTADSGTVYSIEHHLHLYGHHQQSCQTNGLEIDAVLEPFAESDIPMSVHNLPVVLVIRAVKKGLDSAP